MEEASSRSTNPVGFLRRGSGISMRSQSYDEKPSQYSYSNKPGKTTNLNPMEGRWADNKQKPRYLHKPFQSSGSKASSSSSSKGPIRKYYEEKQKRPFLEEVHSAEGSNRRTEVKRLQSGKKAVVDEDGHPYTQQIASAGSSSSTITEGGLPEQPDHEVLDSSVSSGISVHTGYSIVRNTPSSKPHRQMDKEELDSGRSQVASNFVSRGTVPQSSTIGVKSSRGAGTVSTGLQRRGLKNLGCSSISDVLPSGCSSSASVHNRRVEVTKKRPSDGESSSRSGGMSGQASLGQPPAIYPGSTRSSGPRARAAEQSASQQTARTSNRSIQGSTRRPSTQRVRERAPGEREDVMFDLRQTVTRVRHAERGHFSMDDVSPRRLERPFYAELPHAIYSSNRQASSSRTTSRRSNSRPEGSPPQTFHGLFGDRDGYRRINMEGIAEVLLALDRIEQDDELAYEQLLVLETNLLLSGLGLNDQHQDMRLDIDNMSYEELLALEEQIGSVSTALSEEQFVKCVSGSVYKARNSEREVNKIVVDDVKCSICQEEYIEGEEIGSMQCEHRYHVCCIHEWLRQKNWCPICRTSAIPSEMDKGNT